MKLARYTVDGLTSTGVVLDGHIIDLSEMKGGIPTRISEILAAGPALLADISRQLSLATKKYALRDVHLEAPVPEAQKYMAIGMNYQDHAAEAKKAGVPIPAVQLWFNKQVSCINGPYNPVCIPRVSDKLDYEAELGVVIGKRCRYISEEDASSVIGGYFVANDFTIRDWQAASPTYTLGKSFDTHGPIGPWVVTADEISDPHNLEMRLFVNGAIRQQQNTGKMIYNIFQQISHLSQVMTLEPGDLIATGTCSGVGIVTNSFLSPGDVVRVEIDGVGHIENRIVKENG